MSSILLGQDPTDLSHCHADKSMHTALNALEGSSKPVDAEANNAEADNAEADNAEADVIPLEYSGIAATEESLVTPWEMLHSTLKKLCPELQNKMRQEGSYVVHHGGFAWDFGPALEKDSSSEDKPNPSVYKFPHLFPHRCRGIEAKRQVTVLFTEHIWCLLQRSKFHFCKDPIFPFWALSPAQKQQALQAAQLTMLRRDFDCVCRVIGQLMSHNYRKAALDEENRIPASDPKIAILKKTICVTMQKIMGSDAS
ncbi:G-quadruplex DNA unwinding, partial [Rhizoctonia solani]